MKVQAANYNQKSVNCGRYYYEANLPPADMKKIDRETRAIFKHWSESDTLWERITDGWEMFTGTVKMFCGILFHSNH